MAEKKRQDQIASAIQKIAGKFFSQEPPADTLATVTSVEMSPDLNYADIYLSILPADKKEAALKAAKKSLPGLRGRIGEKMKLRKVPKLRVEYDNQSEAKARVEEILAED